MFLRLRSTRSACALGAILCALTACTSVVPEALRGQMDRQVTFDQVAHDPAAYQGRMILIGGEVQRVEPKGPDVDVFLVERPLSRTDESPAFALASRGDAVVRIPGGARAAFHEGQVLTVLGAVLGPATEAGLPGVPLLQARHVHVWTVGAAQFRPEPGW